MLAKKKRAGYTAEQYLALEEQASYKSEYRQGKILAMAGGTINHNRIAGNVYTSIKNQVGGKGCETFIGDVRLRHDDNWRQRAPRAILGCLDFGASWGLEGRRRNNNKKPTISHIRMVN